MKIEEVYSTALVRSFFFRDRCRSWCWCTVPGCISQSIFAGPSLRFRACDCSGYTEPRDHARKSGRNKPCVAKSTFGLFRPPFRKSGKVVEKSRTDWFSALFYFLQKSFVQPSDQGLMPLRDCESGEERRGVQTDRGGHALGDPMISRAGAAENYSRVRADGMPRRGGIR